MSAEELYETRIKPLPVVERQHLKALIERDLLAEDPRYSEEWTEEDLDDLRRMSMAVLGERLRETDADSDT